MSWASASFSPLTGSSPADGELDRGADRVVGLGGDPHILRVPMIDLQSHSTVSDGELPPAEVVAAAAAAGIKTLALTDHDAVDGIAEADGGGAGRRHRP